MRRIKVICILMCFLLAANIFTFGVSAKKTELMNTGGSVYYIETYEQLKNHAFIAQADCRYILSDEIVQEDNLNDLEVVIPAGAVFNLDLNGYNIKRITQGNDCALFRIKSDGRMTISDSSVGTTGGCIFSEGYADYYKAVFYNEGGELEIYDGYYEILSPFEQGDCSIVRTTSGYTNIYDGTFDSSAAWGGDTISVGHNAYVYEVPHVNVFGGEFYGKYSNIDITPFNSFLNYGCLYPSVYVLGGNFYITKESESSGFCYCNNGWGRVIVASGTVPFKCINSRDQRFLQGISKEYITQTIDDYTEGYYIVTAPPVIMAEGVDYYYRLINLCAKAEVNSYDESVYEMHKEDFDYILDTIDTVLVSETDYAPVDIKLENRTVDYTYINWYMVDESEYNGKDTNWTHLGDVQNVTQWTFDERPEDWKRYLVRSVATNSDLETYEDIIYIIFEPLKKAEIIDSVKVSELKTPAVGETPDFEVSAEKTFYINGIYWTDITDPKNRFGLKETDTFEAGHEYELQVWIRANEFYSFKTDPDDQLDIKALVGDKEAEVILPGTPISAELVLIYSLPEESETTNYSDPTESTCSVAATEFTDPTEITKPSDLTMPTESETASSTTEPITDAPDKPADKTEPAESITVPTIVVTEPSTDDEVKHTKPSADDEVKPTEPSTDDEEKPTESTSSDEDMSSGLTEVPSETAKPSAPEVEDKGILGDVNDDGKVNIKDATLIQKALAKLAEFTEAEILRADVNSDTKVNIKDATAIQKFVAKIETGLPIGEPVK